MVIWFDIEVEPMLDAQIGSRSERASAQVRCSGCGAFAKLIRFSPGFFGDDPSWDVDCYRCGDSVGMIGAFEDGFY